MQSVSSALEKHVTAVRTFSQTWLPIQSHTIDYTLRRFREGLYENSRVHLSRDLRQDPSLYLYCVKELSARMPSSDHTPLELFFHAPLDWIYEVLENAPRCETFDSINPLQAARLKQSMVAAVTSELLCPSMTLDPELGYTCSLLRQIGTTLAAWNYPQEYERAISRVRHGHSLDESLHQLLGFCPTSLGSTFARDWRLCSEIQDALRGTKDAGTVFACSERLVRHENPATKIKKICEIGEALAYAMQPELQDEAASSLEQAQVELIRHLGRDAIKTIFETTRQRLLHYKSYELHMPAVVSAEQLKKTVAASVQIDQRKKQNSYLPKLNEELRTTLEDVYQKMTTVDISRDAIRQLVKEVIPAFGFPAGYVYLYSPKHGQLCVNLTIGEPSSNSPQKVSVKAAIHQNLLVNSAYSLKSALRTKAVLPGKGPATVIAGRIGMSRPVGVLYLETTEEALGECSVDPMIRFQALLACLSAALHTE